MEFSIFQGQANCVKFYLDQGCKIEETNLYQQTALFWIIHNFHDSLVNRRGLFNLEAQICLGNLDTICFIQAIEVLDDFYATYNAEERESVYNKLKSSKGKLLNSS